MKRREFVSLFGSAAAVWPLAARAQQPAMPVIGVLHSQSPDAFREPLRAFRQGLKDAGYVEGENVTLEYRWAENQMDRLPALAAELVRRRVNAIAALGGPFPAFAAKGATATIPIVFTIGDDPVRLGLVASLARPGGNVTGISFLVTELAAKRLTLLRELLPAVSRVALLVNPAEATNTEATLKDMEAAAPVMGIEIKRLNASSSREINAAFATLVQERPDAIFVGVDAFYTSAARPVSAAGDAPSYRRYLSSTPFRGSRRTDELRNEPERCLSPRRRLHRPHPQGRKASGPTSRAADQIRARHQC